VSANWIKVQYKSFVILVAIAGAVADARAQEATRDLPDHYNPGATVTVAISIDSPEGTTVVGLEDTPPGGWLDVESISDNGQYDAGNHKVKWGPFFAPAIPTQVSYQVVAPIEFSESGCFSGTASFDGFNQAIGGDECVAFGTAQVPAVSEWGLTSMVLVVLTIGTIAFGKQKASFGCWEHPMRGGTIEFFAPNFPQPDDRACR